MAFCTKATLNTAGLERRLTVNISELAQLLGMGRDAAATVGKEAGAIVRVGRLKRYSVAKVEQYLDKIAEG